MTPHELRERLKVYAIDVGRFAKSLLGRASAPAGAGQLMRAAASAAASYRAACLARSRSELRSRLCLAVEEADERVYWLESLAAAHEVAGGTPLLEEGRAVFSYWPSPRGIPAATSP